MHKDVPLSEIVDNPFQPRKDFEPGTIRSLADEIKAEGFWNGNLQGRRNARGRIELVFGHRRLRALKLLQKQGGQDSVRVEILDLSDAQMALRALEENLQREGLNDFEKADAVKQAIDLERQRRKDKKEPERGATEFIAQRLGLDHGWVSKQCQISVSIDTDDRTLIDGMISAKTAYLAKQWGKKRYLRTLVRQARAATKSDSDVSKPTENTVAAMKRAVSKAPESVRQKLEDKIFDGDLLTSAQVDASARSMMAEKARRRKTPPPDLQVVVVGMTHDLEAWTEKLKAVAPYMDYVEEVPPIAEKFRHALTDLINAAKDILKASR